MGNINNENWMVTFSYEQELRSKYMNGLLNGGFHPGVYNANISLYTIGGAKAGEYDGVFAYIKKGTTLIFSNDYTKVNNDHYERKLDEIGSYLIKAIANSDMAIPLITWSTSSPGLPSDKLGFLDRGRSHQHYLMAKLEYDSESKKVTRPYIFITDKNPEWYGDASSNPKPSEYSTYFKPPKIDKNANVIKSNFTIPDGTKTFFGRELDILPQISWLCLGVINEIPVQQNILETITNVDDAYINSYLTADTVSSAPVWYNRDKEGFIETGDNLWIRYHSFTGRGLPEYRYSLSYNSREQSPDFFIENISQENSISNNLYLDLKNINTGNNIINKENDWYTLQKIGPGQNSDIEFPEKDFTFTLDASSGIDKKIIEKLNSTYDSSTKDLSAQKLILCDLLFLSTPGSLTNTDPSNLIFDDLDQEPLIDNLLKNTGNTPYKILPFRFLSKGSNLVGNLCPNADSEDQLKTYLAWPASTQESDSTGFIYPITHDGYFSKDTKGVIPLNQRLILPLDVSTANFDRLLSIVKNSNIVSKAISYMREHSLIPPDVGSLIPVCISFRKFMNALVATDDKLKPEEKDTSNIKVISADGYSSTTFVNPANVLNFFDLNYKVTSVNTINLKYENTYSVLPIII